jgi:two-component system phosphate regulon sensor histidine kinase PhoR
MSVRHRNISPIVLLIASAMVGLIALQVYLLDSAFELKEQAFRRNVRNALSAAARRLETGEALTQVLRRAEELTPGEGRRKTPPTGPGRRFASDTMMQTRVFTAPADRPGFRVEGNSFYYHVETPQHVRLRMQDVTGRDSLVVDTVKPAGEHVFTLGGPVPARGNVIYKYSADSISLIVSMTNGTSPKIARAPANDRERAMIVSRVVDNLWVSEAIPPERRFRPATLDSVLHLSMAEGGIPIDFSYGIAGGPEDSLRLARPEAAAPDLRRSDLRAPLFLFEPFGPRSDLVVHFPGRDVYLLKQLWPALLASFSFIAVLGFAFVSTIRVIVRQQRLARLMVDFVNNMTHEFKTPISTVALASEAIRRDDVISKKTKVLQYNRMITEEAARMKNHVDRILHMAQLEEGDIELRKEMVDVHAVIASAAANFALQVETRGGKITTDLRATRHTIEADAVHLASIIHNLLDNANKYSPGGPSIVIATANEGETLVVRVKDTGIGIPAEHQKNVFEKYYRVPKGDLHDAKGFGIGLSYVKLLMEAHGGSIGLISETGKGTEVLLRFTLEGGHETRR